MSENQPRKRLKAAESRRALLDAGLELLRSRGVAPGLDRVTLKEAIEVSGVPRSTAYRLYEGGRGQLEEFRAELLRDLDTSVDMSASADAIAEVIEAHADDFASKDPVRYAAVLREVIRVGMQSNVDAHINDVQWRIYMSSLASAGTGASLDDEVTEVYRDAESVFAERYVQLYSDLSARFGLRPRWPMTFATFAPLIAATVEGVALRCGLEPNLSNIKRATGPDGEPQAWNAAAIAFEALVQSWFEPDPSAEVHADISSW